MTISYLTHLNLVFTIPHSHAAGYVERLIVVCFFQLSNPGIAHNSCAPGTTRRQGRSHTGQRTGIRQVVGSSAISLTHRLQPVCQRLEVNGVLLIAIPELFKQSP